MGNTARRHRVLTRGLDRLLGAVFLLTGLITIDTLYLSGVDLTEWLTGRSLENRPYLVAFLLHLVLGLLLVVPVLLFGALHLRRAWGWRRVNRYAVGAGLALYATALLLLVSGLLLTRFGFFEIDDPAVRTAAWWVHVLTPLAVAWLFVLHRLAGPPLDWRPGLAWGAAAVAVAAVGLVLHLQGAGAAPAGARHFLPALAISPGPIPAERLSGDAACRRCHADIYAQHVHSAHHFSSFTNPVYRFSVEETRRFLKARDGHVRVSRLCAGCHDPVLLFSGRFDDPAFDPDRDPHAGDGITCLACHAITAVNSPRGNGDYRIAPPPEYPFAHSRSAFLRAVSRQLIKARPSLHKRSLMHPVLRSAEFCSVCHKVHLPQALNGYRWLRGQDHYDSFLLSG
ncbi:MAG: aspartate phosphatase, partial [Gammaproteobacteria bacterium]